MGLREIISRLSVRGPVAEVAERLRLEAGRLLYRATCPSCCLPVAISRPEKGGRNNFIKTAKDDGLCCTLDPKIFGVAAKLASAGCQFVRRDLISECLRQSVYPIHEVAPHDVPGPGHSPGGTS